MGMRFVLQIGLDRLSSGLVDFFDVEGYSVRSHAHATHIIIEILHERVRLNKQVIKLMGMSVTLN